MEVLFATSAFGHSGLDIFFFFFDSISVTNGFVKLTFSELWVVIQTDYHFSGP